MISKKASIDKICTPKTFQNEFHIKDQEMYQKLSDNYSQAISTIFLIF